MREAAAAAASKVKKQDVVSKDEPPALRERTSGQPVLGDEKGKPH